MKIKLLRSPGRAFPDLREGQVADVADEIADHLCKLNLAERLEIRGVPRKQEAVHTVPPQDYQPGESVQKAEQDAKDYSAKAKGKQKQDGK